MKRFTLLACAGLLAAAMAVAIARGRSAPARLQGASLRSAVQLVRLLCRYQRRLRLGHRRTVQRRLQTRASTPTAVWSASRSATTCRPAIGSGAWKATSTPAGSRAPTTQRPCAPAASAAKLKQTWFGTARGRIGYAFDRWLPYITGGFAVGDSKITVPSTTARPTPASAGRRAPASNGRSWGLGRPRSNISMPISAPRPAPPRLASLRPTSA